MVKPVVLPTRALMAVFASLIRVKFYINFTFVYIVVAISAALPNSFEIPLFFLLMAHNAGGCQVCAFQRKRRFIVIGNAK